MDKKLSSLARCVILAVLFCAPLRALAEGGGKLRSSYLEWMSEGLAQRHVVEVPLVPAEGASVLWANNKKLAAAGIAGGRFGLEDEQFEHRILERFALRRAKPGETPLYIGLATQYSDTVGGVRGDGKVAIVSDLLLKDPKTKRIVGIYEIQLKGVDTGLKPNGQTSWSQHGTGVANADAAFRSALLAEYLQSNGVSAPGWLAVIDLKKTKFYVRDGGWLPKLAKYRTGILVRAGNFLRIAHLYRLREDPKALRELVRHVNQELSIRRGRSHLYPLAGLYRVLVHEKAEQLVGFYWARTMHGSTTLDNVGLFEPLDLSTSHTVDGKNPLAGKWRLSDGYAHETEHVLNDCYADVLYGLLRDAAWTKRDKRELGKIDPSAVVAKAFRRAMRSQALAHVGFDGDDIKRILHDHRAEADTFCDAVITMSKAEERYDPFHVMSGLVEVATSSQTEEAKARQVRTLLNPGGRMVRANAIGRELLATIQPLVDGVMDGLSSEARAHKVRLIVHDARQINRPIALPGEFNAIRRRATNLARAGERQRAAAEIREFVRRNVRKGPQTPAARAMMLRRNQLKTDGRGRAVILSSREENGVRIQEVSDGASDWLHVTVAGNPLQLSGKQRYEMAARINGAVQPVDVKKAAPERTVFEIPITTPLSDVDIHFTSNQGGEKWDNFGVGFGRGVDWALGSPRVQAELGALAQRRGEQRANTPAGAIQAVTPGSANPRSTRRREVRQYRSATSLRRRRLPTHLRRRHGLRGSEGW